MEVKLEKAGEKGRLSPPPRRRAPEERGDELQGLGGRPERWRGSVKVCRSQMSFRQGQEGVLVGSCWRGQQSGDLVMVGTG